VATISIKELNKSYGKVPVLHDVSLDIADNSFVVFVGPSGCGKSTLLRTIAGLEDLNSGHITLDSRDISGDAPVDRDVAMVFQSYALYPQMTVRDNIGFALEMANVGKSEIIDKVQQTASLLRLDDLLDRKPKDLSGGQRQRVAIGRAILRDPKVFLFDEPLSNLDAELRVEMRLQIAALRRNLSATFIYVTHDQTEAMTLADTIVVLRDGRVEQVGPPMTLYHDPDNLFVAGFMGSPKMNFLELQSKSGLAVHDSGISLQLGGKFNDGAFPIVVGVRAEHVLLEQHGVVEAEIEAIENLGAVSYAYCKLSTAEQITIQLNPEHDYKMGDTLRFNIEPDRLYAFDSDGNRIRSLNT